MRRHWFCLALVLLLPAALHSKEKDPTAGFPRSLLHAQYVYVTSMTGDAYNPSTVTEDRDAIQRVEEAIRKWGRYTIVMRPEQADIVFRVRAGRLAEATGGMHVGVGTPPSAGRPTTTAGPVFGADVGPPDDYLEVLNSTGSRPTEMSSAAVLWRRTRHNGLGVGAPLVQDFRKEADAAAQRDAAKQKP